MCFGVILLDTKNIFKLVESFFEPTNIHQDQAILMDDFRIIGLQIQHHLIGLHGFIAQTLHPEGITEVGIKVWIILFLCDDLFEDIDGLGEFPLFGKSLAQPYSCAKKRIVDLEGLKKRSFSACGVHSFTQCIT